MNPEVSPWTIITNKQRLNDLKREEEQRNLKNYLRIQYNKELQEQIQEQREKKMKEDEQRKKYEMNLINTSIENSKKIIELQKMKADASIQKTLRLDQQNEFYNQAKKQHQANIRANAIKAEQQKARKIQQRQRRDRQEGQIKKKHLLESWKQSMNTKNTYQRIKKGSQHEYQNKKLEENKRMRDHQQQQNKDYLQKLKDRAATIDYGAHQAFLENHKRSLIQRKKQEWKNDQIYLNQAKFSNQYQSMMKVYKNEASKAYGSQLKKQITEMEHQKYSSHRKEVQRERDQIQSYRSFSQSLEYNRKREEENKRKELLGYLHKQVEEKQKIKKQEYMLQDKQLAMNMHLFKDSNVFVPGQTYQLDYQRKKQLETVAKSLSISPSKQKNYLADRGRNVLG